ncbi:MAG TPA: M14 family metallopeptidase [Caulobacteraceae bacterium]|jgi:hypothetical protein|nr:M14 family metallopeptidase [Caulobacteraceae bacterium]
MNSAESFSPDYASARTKFREAAAGAGGVLEAVTHPERSPDGGELTTDTAWFGPRAAEAVLVMISGTHGVEGFCGSGAQIDWLRRGEAQQLPGGVAVLMIHAINPYGFAWLRRVTHENVDLNRNWIDFTTPLPANPGYDELAEAIAPPEWTPAVQQQSFQTLGAYMAAHGMPAAQQAISGGQYGHPKGVFYGGQAPTWSRLTQTAIFEAHLSNARRIGIIDYHTGLGPWGYGEQIITDAEGTPGFARARAWYGGAVTCPSSGNSTSTDIVGDGLAGAPLVLSHAEVTGMALEVGTQDTMAVLGALRADNWLHAYGDPANEQGRAIKAQMRAAFYGDADDWKGMVAGQSLLACKQAIAGLIS